MNQGAEETRAGEWGSMADKRMVHIPGTAEVVSVDLGAKAHAETECIFKATSVEHT